MEYDDEDAQFREGLALVPEGEEIPGAPQELEQVRDLAVREDRLEQEHVVVVPQPWAVPKQPTHEEWDNHVLMQHANYRSWCEHCVKTRGRERPHVRLDDSDERAPGAIACDFCCFTDDPMSDVDASAEKPFCSIGGICYRDGSIFACQSVKKSAQDSHTVNVLKNWVVGLGVAQTVLQSDGDPGIMA
jgi:hypothetical protein